MFCLFTHRRKSHQVHVPCWLMIMRPALFSYLVAKVWFRSLKRTLSESLWKRLVPSWSQWVSVTFCACTMCLRVATCRKPCAHGSDGRWCSQLAYSVHLPSSWTTSCRRLPTFTARRLRPQNARTSTPRVSRRGARSQALPLQFYLWFIFMRSCSRRGDRSRRWQMMPLR